MKRILIISSMLLIGLCFMTDMQAQNIHTQWRQKTITVENGGEKPTVIQLLRAFNKVWHYKSTDALLAEAGDKLYVSRILTTTWWRLEPISVTTVICSLPSFLRRVSRRESISVASTTTTPRHRSSHQRMSRLLISAPSGQARISLTPSAKGIYKLCW